MKILGSAHPNTGRCYYNIGGIWRDVGDYRKAIENFVNGYAILKEVQIADKIALCSEKIDDIATASIYYKEAAEIRKHDLGADHKITQESIANCIRLAKKVNKENELPKWIRELNDQ